MNRSYVAPARILATLGAAAATIGTAFGFSLVGAGVASAEDEGRSTVEKFGAEERCGYLGWARYNHCDGGSGATVMLDVEDLWGGISRVCVRPGITDVQPYVQYRVTGAWWNGGVGCVPGRHG
ncbi:DUF6355 family natural product biosynthesis protein [Amycolatopsis lurida]